MRESRVRVRTFAFVLFLLPVILLGTLACGDGDTEPTATASPTQAAQAEATAAPEPTTSDTAPATLVPTDPPPTAAPTATVFPTKPTESMEPTEPPTETLTPTATEAPRPTPTESVEASGSFLVGEGSEITFTVEEELKQTPIRFDAVISGTGLTGYANLDGSPSMSTRAHRKFANRLRAIGAGTGWCS